jgi:hypothetical protein
MRCVGDSGYIGKPDKIIAKKTECLEECKWFIKCVLSRHESVNKRLADFKILRNRFHHGNGTNEKTRLHKMVFQAVVVIVQIMLKK